MVLGSCLICTAKMPESQSMGKAGKCGKKRIRFSSSDGKILRQIGQMISYEFLLSGGITNIFKKESHIFLQNIRNFNHQTQIPYGKYLHKTPHVPKEDTYELKQNFQIKLEQRGFPISSTDNRIQGDFLLRGMQKQIEGNESGFWFVLSKIT